MEYNARKVHGKSLDLARLFVYKETRMLLGWVGDTGAHLRTTLKALALYGAPPEALYPYHVTKFEQEPLARVYAAAQSFQALRYFRLDPAGVTGEALLGEIKRVLAEGWPIAFGFTTYTSLGDEPDIRFPGKGDPADGGHAVMAVGYDDARKVGEHTGAVLIRNSWGVEWGDQGYGWLPYQYVLKGLTADWWAMVESEFVDLSVFE